jgi:hypothetical protein
MKQYDSIDYFGDHWGLPVIAFDKLDGSNLRFEYSHKRGFYKFGTRKQMIDETSEFGFAIDLFLKKYSEPLTRIFKSKEYRNVLSFVCYAELVGTKSAFGQHNFGNDKFDIVLFDVDQYKKGFVPPKEFVKNFSEVGIPRIVYEGNLNKEFIERVKQNEFDLTEGVICKGQTLTRKGRPELYYCKIKTNDWFERLRMKDILYYNKEFNEYQIKIIER